MSPCGVYPQGAIFSIFLLQTQKNNYMRSTYLFGIITFVGVWLHWSLSYPCALSFHEQNQLFMYSLGYFADRVVYPGGMAAYCAEFLTQFYYYPVAGGFILGLLSALLYFSAFSILSFFYKATVGCSRPLPAFLALLLPYSILCLMGDEQIMLCYLFSFTIVLVITALFLGRCSRYSWLLQVLLYLLCGPLSVVYALLTFVHFMKTQSIKNVRKLFFALLPLLTFFVLLLQTYLYITPRYPWPVLLSGIYYYRSILFDHAMPATLYLLPLLVPVLAIVTSLIPAIPSGKPNLLFSLLFVVITVAASLFVRCFYDTDKYCQLEYDYLIRGGNWERLLTKARAHQPHTAMSCTAVNLALSQTEQLPGHQFEYYQCGIEGLLIPHQRDNIQPLPTMEAYYRLGFVNMALWYAFEAQQAIPNQNQSARLTRRLAECHLILGNYEVARKYIDLLKQTQFYSRWARQAETLLYDDTLIALHPEYGRLRNYLLDASMDCLMPQDEIEKILGRLYIQNDGNQMAMNYFLSALLLKGQREAFVGYLTPELQQLDNPFPKGYREYYLRKAEEMKHKATTDAVSGASPY